MVLGNVESDQEGLFDEKKYFNKSGATVPLSQLTNTSHFTPQQCSMAGRLVD